MSASPSTCTKFRCLCVAVAGLVITALAAANAAATPVTSATCVGVLSVQFTPGFTSLPGSGLGSSGGETGKMTCLGTLNGKPITAPGTFGVQESYTTGAACLTDQSSGRVPVTFPTTGGPVSMTGVVQAHRVGLLEFIDVEFPGSTFTGIAVIVPTQGDCLIMPLTRALATVTGTWRG